MIGISSVSPLVSFSVSPSILKITVPFTNLVLSRLSVIVTWNVMFSFTLTSPLVVSVSVACLCFRFNSGVLLLDPRYSSFPPYTALSLYVFA